MRGPDASPHGWLSGDGAAYLCRACVVSFAVDTGADPSAMVAPWVPVWSADTPRTCYACGEPHGPIYAPEHSGNPDLDPWDMPEVEL